MKYRKKPVVIEAVQIMSRLDFDEIQEFLGCLCVEYTTGEGVLEKWLVAFPKSVKTLNGVRGDYIVRNGGGEFCACRHDDFQWLYDRATSARVVNEYEPKFPEVEAVQWDGANIHEIEEFARDACLTAELRQLGTNCIWYRVDIQAIKEIMQVQIGDYIIKNVQGEFYPCKADIFEQTYEPV